MARDILDKDRGLKRIMRAVNELDGVEIKVGVQGDESVDGTSLIDIAVWNEFGTEDGHIPARPFIRHTFDTSRERAVKLAHFMADKLVSGQATAQRVAVVIGEWYQKRTQDSILNSPSWAKENAPSTIARKGSDKPLVDTGRLAGAIRYVITGGKWRR